MGTTLLLMFTLLAIYLLWRDSMRARETAVRVSRKACTSYGLQMLDDTVALHRVRLAWLPRKGLRIRRIYEFDTSADGTSRRAGSISLTGDRIDSIYLPDPDPPGA